jgi:hypothetical protein
MLAMEPSASLGLGWLMVPTLVTVLPRVLSAMVAPGPGMQGLRLNHPLAMLHENRVHARAMVSTRFLLWRNSEPTVRSARRAAFPLLTIQTFQFCCQLLVGVSSLSLSETFQPVVLIHLKCNAFREENLRKFSLY